MFNYSPIFITVYSSLFSLFWVWEITWKTKKDFLWVPKFGRFVKSVCLPYKVLIFIAFSPSIIISMLFFWIFNEVWDIFFYCSSPKFVVFLIQCFGNLSFCNFERLLYKNSNFEFCFVSSLWFVINLCFWKC